MRPRAASGAGTRRVRRSLACGVGLAILAGCVSPVAMHRAVLEYDRTVSRVETELLLLNVARARHHHPIHFTVISGIAATFDFRVTGGLGGGVGETDAFALALEGSAGESPTVSILPVQGEEFTRRLLTPLDEAKFEFLLHQGVEPAILLRLMARALLVESEGGPVLLHNDPRRPESYAEFRRRVLHLSSLSHAQELHLAPLGAGNAGPGAGRIALCNYDPGRLPAGERERLAARAGALPRNAVWVDLRPSGPGGDYPLRGQLLLRNFKEILAFLGRDIAEHPEFAVAPDPRTGFVPRNPVHGLEIRETRERPAAAVFAAREQGLWYSIGGGEDAEASSWNQEAFDLLYQLYQLTVTDVAEAPMPMITISK